MSLFGHDAFYFETLRKMVVYFGTLFNEIVITRTDSSGEITQVMKVPLVYGPKEKVLARVDADPNIDRDAAIVLPRMAFKFEAMNYVSGRKRPDWSRYIVADPDDLNKFKRQYQEVPYDFQFTLWVYSKLVEDGNKVVEQIVPFFTPDFTSTVNIIPEMGIARDIPVVLDSVTHEDMYEGEMEERRAVLWTLNFRVLGMLYGPIVKKPIIKLANTNFYIGNTATADTKFEGLSVQPGLDANGNPTSNINVTIPSANISVDDDWGYIVQFTEGFSNT
jgi:hypothetical protein